MGVRSIAPLHWIEVSAQLHTPAALTPGEAPDIHWIGDWLGPRGSLDAVEERDGPGLLQGAFPPLTWRDCARPRKSSFKPAGIRFKIRAFFIMLLHSDTHRLVIRSPNLVPAGSLSSFSAPCCPPLPPPPGTCTLMTASSLPQMIISLHTP